MKKKKSSINQKYVYQSKPVADTVETITYVKEPSFTIDTFNMKMLSSIEYKLNYPKELVFIGTSDEKNMITYVYFLDHDLDYIDCSLRNFYEKSVVGRPHIKNIDKKGSLTHMDTKEIILDPAHIDLSLAEEAGAVLRRGGLVAFPTETVYGLGANALDGQAVRNIFLAKGRPSRQPAHRPCCGRNRRCAVGEGGSAGARRVMEHFWPGPISIIMKKSDKIGDAVSAGSTR